jgi:hypothetical protein
MPNWLSSITPGASQNIPIIELPAITFPPVLLHLERLTELQMLFNVHNLPAAVCAVRVLSRIISRNSHIVFSILRFGD